MSSRAQEIVDGLHKRGWEQKDLERVKRVMSQSHTRRHPKQKQFDTILPWFLFSIMVLTNIAIMFVIVPLFAVLPNPIIYLILILIGLVFGQLFTTILNDIDHQFRGHHHLFLYIFVPYLAATGGLVIFSLATEQLPNIFYIERSVHVVVFLYIVAFLAPLVFGQMKKFLNKQL
ncbi:MAG: hypothetical protein ACMXYF_01295 [Candidatus Woesearchaeota archaeon]